MRKHLTRGLPSPAMAVAITALFVALGGTGYAASKLVEHSPAAHAAKKKKSSNDTKADTKLVNKLASGLSVKSAGTATNASHATSADSATNATNATNAGNSTNLGGKPASAYESSSNVLTAVVTNVSGTRTLVRGTPGTTLSSGGTGNVNVHFTRDVSACTWIATQGTPDNSFVPARFATVRGDGNPNEVEVITWNTSGSQVDSDFHLVVIC